MAQRIRAFAALPDAQVQFPGLIPGNSQALCPSCRGSDTLSAGLEDSHTPVPFFTQTIVGSASS